MVRFTFFRCAALSLDVCARFVVDRRFCAQLRLPSRATALFPLLFLFGLVPVPQAALDVVVSLLQQSSAWAASALFNIFGVPVVHDGTILTIPGLTLIVAAECSSIRSSSMLLVTTMVLAQLLLRSPWRKALVILLAVPLSIAKNGLRIFVIAMLSTRVDPGYMNGRLHHQGGYLFLLLSLLCIFALLWILRKGDAPPIRTVRRILQKWRRRRFEL